MNSNNNTIQSLIDSFQVELNDVLSQIEYNERSIKEAEYYIRSFVESEPTDFKFFSPRNAENIHKDEIDKTLLECTSYKEQNIELLKRKDTLIKHIDLLNSLIVPKDYGLTLLNVQELDRQRISRDLHDSSLQNLTHLVHRIELCSLYVDEDPLKAKLELSVLNKILKNTIEEIRNTIFDLRPMTFDDLGLKAVFEQLLDGINESGQFEIEKDIDFVSCENNNVLISIYRIVQESLNNIKKHSNADKVSFICKQIDDICCIDIKDNGQGFQVKSVQNSAESKKHFGLSLMKERAELLDGTFKITSRKNKGTSIHIEIPLR